MLSRQPRSFFFFFNDTATTEIYTLSLHDALPICLKFPNRVGMDMKPQTLEAALQRHRPQRSEEHTSELQSPDHLVCRLLLEKKKKHNLKYNGRFAKLSEASSTDFSYYIGLIILSV